MAVSDLEGPYLYIFSAGGQGNPTISTYCPGVNIDPENQYGVTGLTGLDWSGDGFYIWVASPWRASWRGTDDVYEPGLVFSYFVLNGEVGAPITVNQKPFGVTRSPKWSKYPYMFVAVRGSESRGVTVIDTLFRKDKYGISTNLRGHEPRLPKVLPLRPMISNKRAQMELERQKRDPMGKPVGLGTVFKKYVYDPYLFDINSAEQIVFTRDGELAFVLFNNTFLSHVTDVAGVGKGQLVADPARDPHSGRGGNIGILIHPFEPRRARFVVATEDFPFSWPDGLTLGPYNKYLFMTLTGTNQVVAYDLTRLRKALQLIGKYMPEVLQKPERPFKQVWPLETYVQWLMDDYGGAKKGSAMASDPVFKLLGDGTIRRVFRTPQHLSLIHI